MNPGDQRNLFPAFLGALILHGLVLFGGLIILRFQPPIVPVQVTPVTLLTSADLARLTAAQRSETPEQGQSPEPKPEPAPTPPAPTPAPKPTPPPAPAPQPKAMPAPTPKAAPSPAPKPAEKAPAKPPEKTPPKPPAKAQSAPAKGVDLDALAKSLAVNTKASSPIRSGGNRGAPRPELDLADRPPDGAARATSTSALSQIRDKLIKLWSPNCSLETAANVRILVKMNLNLDGSLAGQAQLVDFPGGPNTIKDDVLRASAIRALSAVSRGSPYDNLPRDDYNFWKSVALNFDAKQACGGR